MSTLSKYYVASAVTTIAGEDDGLPGGLYDLIHTTPEPPITVKQNVHLEERGTGEQMLPLKQYLHHPSNVQNVIGEIHP